MIQQSVRFLARRRFSALAAASLLLAANTASTQPRPVERATPDESLRQRIERRFDVLPLRDGLALRPKAAVPEARSIEVSGGAIAIDGVPVTGAELRQKLGGDAELILQLSYLADEDRRALFGTPQVERVGPPPPARTRARTHADRVRIGGSVTVNADEAINGNVVAIGGSARVDGEVDGDIVAVGGSVDLGPGAAVSRNVVVIGGVLRRDPSARIGGNVQEISAVDFSRWRWPSLRTLWLGSTIGAAFTLMATLTRIAVLCLLAALIMLIGHEPIERISARAAAEPLKAGAIGLLAQIAFLPLLIVTIFVLILTIVGIPLLILVPFLVLGLVLVALVGFTAVAYGVGRLASARLGWVTGPSGSAIIGILIMLAPLIAARLGGLGGGLLFPATVLLGAVAALVEYLAWTVGFGAVALVRFMPRTPSV